MVVVRYKNYADTYYTWCQQHAGATEWKGKWDHTSDSCMDWSDWEYIIEFNDPAVELMFRLTFGY
jgi:hypothetical protein